MKNIYLILLTVLILTSCEDKKATSVAGILATNDVAQIKSKKAALDAKQQELSSELKQLNDRLDALNEDKNIPLITTFTTKKTVFTHFIELQGNVQTKQNVLIYPEIPGILKSVFVKKVKKVKKKVKKVKRVIKPSKSRFWDHLVIKPLKSRFWDPW